MARQSRNRPDCGEGARKDHSQNAIFSGTVNDISPLAAFGIFLPNSGLTGFLKELFDVPEQTAKLNRHELMPFRHTEVFANFPNTARLR